MIRQVALLRAVNVGGHNRVAMARLREFMAALGAEDVQTLIQSGNAVFRGPGDGDGWERRFEAEARKRLGIETDFFVRSGREWARIVSANPFRTEASRDPGRLLAVVLKAAPGRAAAAELEAAIPGRERVQVVGKVAYAHYPDGMGRSRLSSVIIERKLGTRGTARNWNVVLKLGELLQSD